MFKKRVYLIIFIIFVFGFLAGNFTEPKYFNFGMDFLSKKLDRPLFRFPERSFKLGLDLQGGTHLIYQADLTNFPESDRSSAMEGLRDVIERRVNLFGVAEPVVQVQGERLIVELAGVKDVSQAISMLGQTPYLEFKEQRAEEEAQKILAKKQELQGKSFEEIQLVPDWQIALEDPYFKATQLTGRFLQKAEVIFDSNTQQPTISLQFNEEGAKIFEELTANNVGKILAIYIDQIPISTPVVQEKIVGGKAQITGKFTIQEAKDLARNLNAGALPVPITLISQNTVGPSLGALSLEKSLKAGIIGFLAVIIFLIIFYRLPGILACLALFIYIFLNLSLFKLIPVTLTLAGIAGFILSIGMAVDANVLIFSRLKEELKTGKDFKISLAESARRAWPSIRDSNFNTLIVSAILFAFGTSFVKGFAFTLILGVLISMFSAIFITNNFLRLFEGTRLERIKWLWR